MEQSLLGKSTCSSFNALHFKGTLRGLEQGDVNEGVLKSGRKHGRHVRRVFRAEDVHWIWKHWIFQYGVPCTSVRVNPAYDCIYTTTTTTNKKRIILNISVYGCLRWIKVLMKSERFRRVLRVYMLENSGKWLMTHPALQGRGLNLHPIKCSLAYACPAQTNVNFPDY